MTQEFYVVVNKHNNPQGVDQSSGGYPYTVDHLPNAHFWLTESESTRYCNTINYGDRGYRVVKATINIEI